MVLIQVINENKRIEFEYHHFATHIHSQLIPVAVSIIKEWEPNIMQPLAREYDVTYIPVQEMLLNLISLCMQLPTCNGRGECWIAWRMFNDQNPECGILWSFIYLPISDSLFLFFTVWPQCEKIWHCLNHIFS